MSMTIVVVDDETPICEWLAFCIRKASDSYQVRTATNGEEAYALIMREKPDIVFTDIRMPGMNGLDLMRKVLGRLPQTIFAVLTNHAEFSYAQQALSLGAREYFLKSELRAADIEAFIEGVLKIKEELAVIKKEDVFPSGCIDLFRLFKHQEEVDIVDQFWAKQGMAEKEAYLVLALETTHDPELWRLILQVPAKVLRSSMGKIYTAVSRIRGNHYLVLQAADESLLDSLAHAFADMIGDTTSLSVGISPVHHSRSDYMTASNQASLALNALFFSSKTMAHFEDLRACPLDRAHFHSEKAAVLDLVAQRRYGEASAAISSWFDALTCAGPPDIDWAIDYCRRMVLAIEERYYQLTNTSTQETGKLSDTIRSAVQYIHDHYGRPISLAEVAGHVYRSPEYFSRQFKNEIGENFSVYLTLYRLGQAQELLRKSDLLISEVAARVGYNSAGYFSRLYKKYKGIPPEQERMSK